MGWPCDGHQGRGQPALPTGSGGWWMVIEACNHDSLAVLDELLLDDVEHFRQLVCFRAAVTDEHWMIEEQIAQGETVVSRLCVEGHFSGPLLGRPLPGDGPASAGLRSPGSMMAVS